MVGSRLFILRDGSHAAELVRFLKESAGPAAKAGRPLQVVVSEHKPKRSNASNAFMWAAVLEPIAQAACVDGRWFDAETWARFFKLKFLPEVTAAGVEKWHHMPDGERELAMSTADLNSAEMAEYLSRIQAYAATELGVSFDTASV